MTMLANSPTTRFLCCFVIAAVGSLVVGAPLLRLAGAGHRTPLVMTESESSADGELHSFEWKISEVAALDQEVDLGVSHVHAIHDADESWDSEFAFADGHLHRGPPGC
jgi:hypothetical protein